MKKHLLAMLLVVMAVCAFVLTVPAQAAEEDIDLLYDDRKELTALVDGTGEVTISNEVVTSYKVGTTTKDDHVLVYEDGVLYAVGTGTATLTVGQKSYNVTVSAAPISLFMITGHSIGAGQEGNGTQSVVVEAGQAYSSYHQNSLDVTKVDGYGLGWGSEKRVGVSGVMRWDSYGQLDAYAPGEGGNTGSGSGFAYRWNQVTGEKVWVINIAIGGSCVNEWLPGSQGHNTSYDLNYYNQTISKFTYAQTILKNEVAAGHYSLSKQGILNFPGYNFTWYPNWSSESLQKDYELLWNSYTQELGKIDIDGDGAADGLDIMAFTVAWAKGSNLYDRPAAWYMGTNKDFPMVVSSAGTLNWCADLATFPQIDYTTQSVAPYMPDSKYHPDQGGTSANSLFCKADTTHYSQVGYNAIGLDMGANLAAYFFDGTPAATELRLETQNSTEIGNTMNLYVGQSFQITPVVKPVYVDNLTYEVTGNAEITYPLMIKGTAAGTATLTVKQGSTVLKTVNITVKPAHTHCTCGGKHSESEYHTCTEAITYVPLNRDQFTNYRYDTYNATSMKFTSTGESYALRSGNYFLDGDYTMSSSICVAPGETVNLCLNGHKLTVNARAFKPNGNLNICDCSEHGTGSVYANTTNTAPVLYSYSGSVVNIYGGTYSSKASTNREFAGCIGVANDMGLYDVDIDGDGDHDDADKLTGQVNIYDGKFIGSDLNCTDGSPTVSGRGACIYIVNTKSTLNVYGGEFVGAKTVPLEDGGKGGGGVISNNGICNIYGGTFRGSRDGMGAIWTTNSKLTVSGSPVFEDNNNADIFLNYCDHFYVGEDGINVEEPIRVAGSVDNYTQIHLTDEAQAACFVGVHGLTMTKPANLIMKFTRDNTYCECGGTISDEIKALSGHTCKDSSWLVLNQNNLTTRFTTTSTTQGQTSTARYYLKSKEVWVYLSCDVNLTNEIEISDGYTLHIDLNGYTITHSTGSASLFRVYGNLTICDSSAEQTGKAIGVRTGTSNAEAACVYVLNYNSYGTILGSPEFRFYSGTLTGFNITSNTNRTRVVANQAGVVQIGNNAGNKTALFNMYGGTISDGIAAVAGNVYLGHGVMNMYDGLIEGGTSTGSYGGNLRIGSSNFFTMYGGTLRNGTTQGGSGGNIFISSGTNKILGGTFENGWASGSGGNIYLGGGTLTVDNATLIGGCAVSGGNMYLYNGTANVTNTVMKNGKAGYTFTRNADGTLSHSTTGAPSGSAGNLYINDATGNLVGCTLENGISHGKNSTNGFGGNIYNKYTLTMDNCTVSGGSGFRGGVVGIRDSSSLGASYTELKNCTFFGNSATVSGSSVGLWADNKGAEIVIENCSFDDTNVSARNGVIALTDQNCTAPVTLTVKDCTIKNTTFDETDCYGIYASYGTVILEGDLQFDTKLENLYLTDKGSIMADSFTPEEPATIATSFMGKIGTCATDKSDCFVSDTKGVTWHEGVLSINGLLQGAEDSYKTFAAALEANEARLTLLSDYTGDAQLTGDLYLDLNGNVLTGNITGTGTLYGMDSATNDYTDNNMGRITGTVECPVATQFKDGTTLKRYLAISDNEGYSFHRFYLGITHATLKPGAKGVGYKAVFAGSDKVAEHIDAFGYSLTLEGNSPVTREKDGTEFESMKTVTLRVDNYNAEKWGTKGLTAQVYMVIDGETVMSAECTNSLQSLVEQINANASAFTADQLSAIAAWIAESDTMKSWKVENLYSA